MCRYVADLLWPETNCLAIECRHEHSFLRCETASKLRENVWLAINFTSQSSLLPKAKEIFK